MTESGPLSAPRRFRRRKKPFLALGMHGMSFILAAKITQPMTAVLWSAVDYWIIHAQYFTLINLNLSKLQFCASFSLLLSLLAWP